MAARDEGGFEWDGVDRSKWTSSVRHVYHGLGIDLLEAVRTNNAKIDRIYPGDVVESGCCFLKIITALAMNSVVHTLSIADAPITNSVRLALAEMLQKNETITALDLKNAYYHSNWDDETRHSTAIEALAKGLCSSPSLLALRISFNIFTARQSGIIMDALAERAQIKELDFTCAAGGAGGIRALTVLPRLHLLEVLVLSKSLLTSEHCSTLVQYLHGGHMLKRLGLSACNLSDSNGVEILQVVTSSMTLLELDLSNNYGLFKLSGMQIPELLKNNSTLQTLNMGGSNLHVATVFNEALPLAVGLRSAELGRVLCDYGRNPTEITGNNEKCMARLVDTIQSSRSLVRVGIGDFVKQEVLARIENAIKTTPRRYSFIFSSGFQGSQSPNEAWGNLAECYWENIMLAFVVGLKDVPQLADGPQTHMVAGKRSRSGEPCYVGYLDKDLVQIVCRAYRIENLLPSRIESMLTRTYYY
jgi:hypothetical protein